MSPHRPTLAVALALCLLAGCSLRPLASADRADRVALWNGSNLTGWKLVLKNPADSSLASWDAKDGVLRLHSLSLGYLRTEAVYADYHLHLEWRWPAGSSPKSNSGVLIHLRGPDVVWPACIQIQQKIGAAGQLIGMETALPDFPVINNQSRAPLLALPSEKALGEWNTCDIHATGDTLEVHVNDVRQNYAEHLPVRAGRIGLQLEGAPIEFRNLWLRPLAAAR
jgi:hypothetical protein